MRFINVACRDDPGNSASRIRSAQEIDCHTIHREAAED
jgi:hypothetical protein